MARGQKRAGIVHERRGTHSECAICVTCQEILMNQQTKTVAALAAAVAAGYVGLSWWMGHKAELHTRQAVEWVQGALGDKASVSDHYQRGLFSDENTIVLEWGPLPQIASLASEGGTQTPVRVHISQHVSHGALGGVTTQLKLDKIEGLPEAVRQAFAQAAPPEITLHRPLVGDMKAQLLLPAGQVAIQPPGQSQSQTSQASWQPMSYELRMSQDRQHLSGQWQSAGMQATFAAPARQASGPLHVRLGEAKGQFSAHYSDDLWLLPPGQQEGRIAGLQISLGDTSLLRLDQMNYKAETTREADAISVHGNYTGAGEIGSVALQNLNYDVRLEHINIAALQSAQQIVTHTWNTLSDENLQEPQRQEAIKALKKQIGSQSDALLRQLLSGQPAMHVRYGATIAQQAGSLEYSVALTDAGSQAPKSPVQLPPLFELMQRASVKASMHIPRAWSAVIAQAAGRPDISAESLEQMADGFAAQGFLQNENGAWSASFELEPGGKMRLNGQPLGR